MAKGVKRVASDSNKKSRYQTEGYKRSEQRKKLTRRINRIRNDISSGKIGGAQNISNANSLIAELERLKGETYINRKTGKYAYNEKRLESTIEYATRRREAITLDIEAEKVKSKEERRRTQIRKNEIFQRELNLAGRESDVAVSKISKSEMKIFYRYTQDVWQGADLQYRNTLIMQHFNTDSLEEAFNIVMQTEEAQEALEASKTAQEPEKGVSPDYIDLLSNLLQR